MRTRWRGPKGQVEVRIAISRDWATRLRGGMVGWAILKAEVDDFDVLFVAIGCYVWIGILRVYGGREKRKLMCLRKDAIIRRKKKTAHTQC